MAKKKDLPPKEREPEASELTEQQERFCEAYLIEPSGKDAAIKAGYEETSARFQASRLLTYPAVKARIDELKLERSERTRIDADYVLMTIRDTVERCRQAEPVMEFNQATKSMEPTGEWKFEHSGVLKGCELLGKHLKLFTDRHEHSGPDGKPIELRASEMSDEELEAKVQALLEASKNV